MTQCYDCGVILDDWKDSDIVIMQHFQHSPRCPTAIKHKTQDITNYAALMSDILVLLRKLEVSLEEIKRKNVLKIYHGNVTCDCENVDTVDN